MIVYCGDNNFASFVAVKNHLSTLQKAGRDVVVIDADEVGNLQEITHHLDGVGLFGDEKVVYAKRFFKNKGISEQLENRSDLIANDNLIIWEEGSLDKRKKFFKQLPKNNINEFTLPKPYEISNWLMNHASKYFKLLLKKSQAELIVSLVGENLWNIHNELKKIQIYAESKKVRISDELITQIVSDYTLGKIWKFLDAFGNNDKKTMANLLPNLLQETTDIHYLISMLSRELRLMSQVKTAGNSEIAGVHPFVLSKAKEKAANFDLTELKSRYMELLRLDTAIKNGEMEPQSGLYLYLFK